VIHGTFNGTFIPTVFMGFINQQTSQRGPHWAPLGAARWGLGDVSPEVVLSLLGKAKT